jgi:hypothetical protein
MMRIGTPRARPWYYQVLSNFELFTRVSVAGRKTYRRLDLRLAYNDFHCCELRSRNIDGLCLCSMRRLCQTCLTLLTLLVL